MTDVVGTVEFGWERVALIATEAFGDPPASNRTARACTRHDRGSIAEKWPL